MPDPGTVLESSAFQFLRSNRATSVEDALSNRLSDLTLLDWKGDDVVGFLKAYTPGRNIPVEFESITNVAF